MNIHLGNHHTNPHRSDHLLTATGNLNMTLWGWGGI